ncbi:hypothetical protein SCUCBS95973_008964 [Sporothrix curviconia]|uniref:Uncharacterized protein n=1 Tax=Sporothrix curviconia TaxID=1260050 RepID=A0ABP0CR24_9PEZI
MDVVAVSVSMPQTVEMNGAAVVTSIIHEPITDPDAFIELSSNGIVGNETEVHDGPVYAFFAEHYDHWSRTLGIDRSEWGWCHWGENITFRCPSTPPVTEWDLHLGDVWQVGATCLQVCGGRIPCFKLAWRCGQDDQWLRPLSESGFVGAYFRVQKPGRVYPGDKPTLISKAGETIDMATVCRIGFGIQLETRDTLDLLAKHPTLLGLNRWIFNGKLSALRDKELEGHKTWKGWRTVRISRFETACVDGSVASFYLEPVEGQPLAYYLPGQFVSVRMPTGDVRCWSLSDWPRDVSAITEFRVSIKRQAGASRWMHDCAVLVTELEIMAPAGAFTLDRSQTVLPRQVYFSATVGITPILAMLKVHSTHPVMDMTPGVWIHVTTDARSIPFQGEWVEIQRRHPYLQRQVFCTRPGPDDVLGKDYDVAGRPTLDTLMPLIGVVFKANPFKVKVIQVDASMSSVYICGSTSFETSIRDVLATPLY